MAERRPTGLNTPEHRDLLSGNLVLEGGDDLYQHARLPYAFAQLDADKQQKALASTAVTDPATTSDVPTPIASASLPAPDRSVVRSEAMQRRVRDAARSRAPRTAPAGQATAE